MLNTIHSTDYGYLSITVPALNPEKTHEYYHQLDIPVRDHCIVPWTQANINYNGDVTFCADYVEYPLGNIKEKSFKEIYNGERANKFRHAMVECPGAIFPGCIRCYQNMLFGKKRKVKFGFFTDDDPMLPELERLKSGENADDVLDGVVEFDIGIHPGDKVTDDTGIYGDQIFTVQKVDLRRRIVISTFEMFGTDARIELRADEVSKVER